jgi:hypothetical protein
VLWATCCASVVMIKLDGVALACCVFSLSVVFIKLCRAYKKNNTPRQ